MPQLKAITFDVWGTILWPRDPKTKVRRRFRLISNALARAGHRFAVSRLESAWQDAIRLVGRATRSTLREVGPAGRWAVFLQQLGLEPRSVPFDTVSDGYDQLTLDLPPELMPGVSEAIQRLNGRFRLAVVCNTGFISGHVLREVLRGHGVLQAFESLAFSNEVGRLKPDPSIFHDALRPFEVSPNQALHVGDLEELDVQGAHAAGLLAARYDPWAEEQKPPSQAEAVFHAWADFETVLERLEHLP